MSQMLLMDLDTNPERLLTENDKISSEKSVHSLDAINSDPSLETPSLGFVFIIRLKLTLVNYWLIINLSENFNYFKCELTICRR